MGCTNSKIDYLPAVSMCHDRCKFLEEALRQSYAFADAHLSYMHSLKSLGPTLGRFFDQGFSYSPHSQPNAHVQPNLSQSSSSSAGPDPCPCPTTSDSESSHLDFPSDSEDEGLEQADVDLLHRIHPNYFNRRTPSPAQLYSSYYHPNDAQLFPPQSPPYGGVSSSRFGSSWKTPSPPAPRSSTWDFLNLFEAYDRYELLKIDAEATNDPKNDKSGRNYEKRTREKDRRRGSKLIKEKDKEKPEEQVNAMKTNADSGKQQTKKKCDSAETVNRRSVTEIMKEVEDLFEKAADSGNEVVKFLDTGKFRYYHKNSVYQGASSKLSHAGNKSKNEKANSVNKSFDEDLGVSSVNLSSTLKKLCIWEKKLYDEVKAEEKLRTIYARYCTQMRSLREKGANPNKVDSTQTLIRTISTKIRVSIQVIDKISIKISKLRDEELWPQIVGLVQKLLEMWKVMLECHRCQSKAVEEANNLNTNIASSEKFSETYLEVAIQLKIELDNWNMSFSNWITAQRGYVRALNGWLLKCLPHEPEGKAAGSPPLSPGKTGAPPVFVFCDQWTHALDKVSEMEVIDSMYGIFVSLNLIIGQQFACLQQRVIPDKDIVKKIKSFEREEKRMQKVIESRGKRVFLSTGDTNGVFLPGGAVHISDRTNSVSFDLGLKQIFLAIDKFSADTVQAYEELHVHIPDFASRIQCC